MTCTPILEGYGLTETTAGMCVTTADEKTSGHVGYVKKNCEFKLVDVPDMDYTSEDRDERGGPAPRGEICMRGPCVFVGYYKDGTRFFIILEPKTREAIDADGWFHSGDIGLVMPNNALKIIDRKKNIFKLQHGEYVAPEKIENVYKRN